jgi:hypothetical protein
MKRRRHTPAQIIRKLREADRLLAEGREVPEVAKHLEVSEATYHRWRAQSAWERPAPFGGSRGSFTLAWTEPYTEGAGRCLVSLLLVVSLPWSGGASGHDLGGGAWPGTGGGADRGPDRQ